MPSHPGTPHFLGSSLFLPKHCSTFYLWIFRTYSHSSTAHSRKGFITLWLIRAKAQKGKGGNLNDYVRKRKKLFFLPSTSLLNHAATRVKCNQESSSWKYTKQLRVPSGLSMMSFVSLQICAKDWNKHTYSSIPIISTVLTGQTLRALWYVLFPLW